MAQCASCNGWGWVMRINSAPPQKKEHREKTLKLILANPRAQPLKTQVCLPCGGYGQRPDPATR